jgi:hypothetical protein
MLSLALDLFVRSRLPWDRKLILCGIFGLSVFVILSAVLNKYYSFTHPFGLEWTYWYVRESSTAILVANLPFLWTLLRRMFNLKSFSKSSNEGATGGWHSARSARGRYPTGGPTSSNATNNHLTNKDDPRPRSGNSSIDMPPHSVVSINAAESNGKQEDKPKWKEQGVFGRADLDDLTVDPWASGEDSSSHDDRYEKTSVSTSGASGERPLSPSHHRRIRDEEAQYAMQEGLSLKYFELDNLNVDGNRKV